MSDDVAAEPVLLASGYPHAEGADAQPAGAGGVLVVVVVVAGVVGALDDTGGDDGAELVDPEVLEPVGEGVDDEGADEVLGADVDELLVGYGTLPWCRCTVTAVPIP